MLQKFRFAQTLSLSALLLAVAMPAGAQVRAVPSSAAAQQDQLADRLDRMEDALQDLQAVVYAAGRPRIPTENAGTSVVPPSGPGGIAPTASDAELAIRLSNIEAAMAELTGQVEELAFRLQRQQRTVDQLAGQASNEYGAASTLPDLSDAPDPASGSDRFGTQNAPGGTTGAPLDLRGGPDAAATTPSGEPGGPAGGSAPNAPSVTLPDDPDAAFEEAFQYVLSADYAQAEANLEAFVEKFPESPQTPEAKYLLGEIYLATGANSEAARVFLDHVSTYKDDPRSPEAYLKLGISFSRLNRPEEACRVFNAGVKKFPDMEQRLMDRFDEERSAASCT